MKIVVAFILLFSAPAHAWTRTALDVFLVGNWNFSTKAHLAIGIGNETFSLGPFVFHEQYNPEVSNISFGGAVLFGSDWSFQIAGGVVKEKTHDFENEGVMGLFVIRKKLAGIVQLSLPLIYKDFTDGNDLRQVVDAYPMFGILMDW